MTEMAINEVAISPLDRERRPAIMAVPEFLAWLDEAKRGDRIVYHKGLLGRDIGTGKGTNRCLVGVAGAAMEAYGAGLVHLFQRREPRKREVMDYDYIAEKR